MYKTLERRVPLNLEAHCIPMLLLDVDDKSPYYCIQLQGADLVGRVGGFQGGATGTPAP